MVFSLRSIWRPLVVIGLTFGLSSLCDSQSLGELARREQAKKKVKPPTAGPSYSDQDLKAGRDRSRGSYTQLAAPAVEASPQPSPSPEAAPSPEPDRYVLEREWRRRFSEARTRIAEAETRAWEERIEVVFVSGIPVQQKVRVKLETPDLRQARQALADLEEELRRAGLPPGWGRE
jgi:enamine deaminase RidA (YjgF/YER057c/UK114 family)